MAATTLKRANAMPAPTWHRLDVNDVDIELPDALEPSGAGVAVEVEGLREDGSAFADAMADLQRRIDAQNAEASPDERAVLRAATGEEEPGNLELPALSQYEQLAVCHEVVDNVQLAFDCGLGGAAESWISQAAESAGARWTLASERGGRGRAALRLAGGDGQAAAADLAIVAAPGSELELSLEYDSPAGGAGVAAARLRVFAGAGARVRVELIQTLDAGWTALDASGYVLDEGAQVQVTHRVLGAGASYTGLAADLRGADSGIGIDTRYVGHGGNLVDVNYVVRHHGQRTTCDLNANGVLLDESRKTLRGTIDLVHGCKGSEGSERDTVLLADERAQNRTVPVILCDEDDVAGNHGATIGHVRREQLNYLQSRGLSQKAAEGLFATAALEEAAAQARSAEARAGVARIAAGLDVPFAGIED